MTAFFSISAWAGNHLVFFGGGSSSLAQDVFFDPSLKNTKEFAKKSGWQSEFYYRKKMPESLTPEEKVGIKEFSPQSFRDKINSLIADINSGKIQPQEQLLVVLSTHGKLDSGKLILTADQDNVEVDSLKELVSAAERKGVKLGVVGSTCYSGSLMKYMTPNTCLITIAQPDKVGFESDLTGFSKLVSADKPVGASNLEELYLNTRLENSKFATNGVVSQPMISTQAGVAIDEMLYPLKRGLFHKIDLVPALDQPVCVNTELAMTSLQENMKDMTIVTKGFWIDGSDEAYPLLKEKMDEYNKLYRQVDDYQMAKSKVACNYDGEPSSPTFLRKNFCLGVADLEPGFPGSDLEKDGTRHSFAQLRVDLRKTKEYQEYRRLKNLHQVTINRMLDLSRQIAELERQVYDQAYKKASKEFKGPNPCRDFKI